MKLKNIVKASPLFEGAMILGVESWCICYE